MFRYSLLLFVRDVKPGGESFAFHGRAGDTVLIALNGDPEGDSSPADPVLDLVGPTGTVLKSANFSGLGGKEFIEYAALPSEGVYAYCLRVASGAGNSGATYKVGLIRNGYLYYPAYEQAPEWLNPGPGNTAKVGDILKFRLTMTNLSPITIPGGIDFYASYSEECLAFAEGDPAPTFISAGYLGWQGLKPTLEPGESFSVMVNLQALDLCVDVFQQSTILSYYFTGTGSEINYLIGTPTFLPLAINQQ